MSDKKLLKAIESHYKEITDTLFTVNEIFTYPELINQIVTLTRAIERYEGDGFENFDLWSIGEYSHCSLDNFLAGAFWHFTEWHSGQDSDSYVALSCLGVIYNPGMTDGVEPESSEYDAYKALESMAEKSD